MPLNRSHTAKAMIGEALRELGYGVNTISYLDRMAIINRSIEGVFEQFHALMGNSYMTALELNRSTVGKYGTSGTGTYTPTTGRLVFPSLNSGFTSSDAERHLMMRSGTAVYAAHISSVINATTIVVRGNDLPATTATIDELMIAGTIADNAQINLGNIRLNRLSAIKIRLESSATQYVRAASLDELHAWSATGTNNRKAIIYTINGDAILLKKGSGLSTYGTLTLYYPRTPEPVYLNTDAIDIPDGAPYDLAMHMVKARIIQRETGKDPGREYLSRIAGTVQNLYQSFGLEVKMEEVEKVVERLA